MGNKTRTVLLAALLLAALGSAGRAGVLDLFKGSPADRARSAGVVETADAVKIPLSALASGKALFLSIPSEGTEYRYFALKSGDGRYRAALDACDVCYRARKGYRQEGDKVVCNNCDMKFDSAKIGEKKGGCNPHGLPSAVEGSSLVILKSDILAGKRYFR